MKNKKMITGSIVALIVLGIIFIVNSNISKGKAKKPPLPAKAQGPAAAKAPAKRAFSKDMGGLTVKIKDIGKKDMHLRMNAYKTVDNKSSVYAATFNSNNMQELLPGAYDIQIETLPAMIYKGVEVSKGRQTIKDLGSPMGGVNIKLLNYGKKNASIPVRILNQRSRIAAASGITNRTIQILPGVYDVEINTIPKQTNKDLKVEAGRETAVDMGSVMSALIIKATDENNREVRLNVRIKKADNGELVTSAVTNRPIEILKGTYTVELLSSPSQTKKDVSVESGTESTVEFTVAAPPAPAKRK